MVDLALYEDVVKWARRTQLAVARFGRSPRSWTPLGTTAYLRLCRPKCPLRQSILRQSIQARPDIRPNISRSQTAPSSTRSVESLTASGERFVR